MKRNGASATSSCPNRARKPAEVAKFESAVTTLEELQERPWRIRALEEIWAQNFKELSRAALLGSARCAQASRAGADLLALSYQKGASLCLALLDFQAAALVYAFPRYDGVEPHEQLR